MKNEGKRIVQNVSQPEGAQFRYLCGAANISQMFTRKKKSKPNRNITEKNQKETKQKQTTKTITKQKTNKQTKKKKLMQRTPGTHGWQSNSMTTTV